MFHHRRFAAGIAVALAGALIAPVGCKKKEEAKPAAAAEAAVKKDEAVKVDDKAAAPAAAAAAAPAAAPAQPDVELAAGDGIALWVSIKSLNGLFDAVEMLAGKLGATQPGQSLRGQAIGGITALAAQNGVKDLEWLDKTKPIHVVYHDQVNPAAAPGAPPNPAEMAGGVFAVIPVTGKDAALAALTTAAKDAAAEGHAAMITAPKGEKMYVDFVGNSAVVTMMDKDRFAKVKGFAERIAKVDPPAVLYAGVSIEDLAKTRSKEIEQALSMVEQMANKPGADPTHAKMNAQVMGMYTKMLKMWVQDLTRCEVLVNADTGNLRFEFRLQAKDGSKLGKQLASGRGRTTGDIANLLPSNSYFTVAASSDPAAMQEQMDEAMGMVKELFKLDAAASEALLKDAKDLAKLQDGTSAFGLYADGASAIGLLTVGGTTDGEASMRVGKRLLGTLGQGVINLGRAEAAAKGKTETAEEKEMLALIETSLKEGKLEPILAKVAPLAAAKGLTLASSSSKDGGVACDVLDMTIDFTKMPDPDSAKVKALVGEKIAIAGCAGKNKVAFAIGAGALEKARAAASGKAGGLADNPAYKNATAANSGSAVIYINPGAALAAFKAVVPPGMTLPGDKAAVISCVNRTKSYGCAFDTPVDLIVAAKNLAGGPGGGDMPPPAAGGDPAGGMKAPEPPPAPAPVK